MDYWGLKMRSDIDKDVVTILDRYSIDAIMDKMIVSEGNDD